VVFVDGGWVFIAIDPILGELCDRLIAATMVGCYCSWQCSLRSCPFTYGLHNNNNTSVSCKFHTSLSFSRTSWSPELITFTGMDFVLSVLMFFFVEEDEEEEEEEHEIIYAMIC
jgi:hypothetical protein